MAICRVMLMAYRDFCCEEDYGLHKGVHYDDYDLICGIDYAENMNGTHFPHDDDIDFEGFIKWAKNALKG